MRLTVKLPVRQNRLNLLFILFPFKILLKKIKGKLNIHRHKERGERGMETERNLLNQWVRKRIKELCDSRWDCKMRGKRIENHCKGDNWFNRYKFNFIWSPQEDTFYSPDTKWWNQSQFLSEYRGKEWSWGWAQQGVWMRCHQTLKVLPLELDNCLWAAWRGQEREILWHWKSSVLLEHEVWWVDRMKSTFRGLGM